MFVDYFELNNKHGKYPVIHFNDSISDHVGLKTYNMNAINIVFMFCVLCLHSNIMLSIVGHSKLYLINVFMYPNIQ